MGDSDAQQGRGQDPFHTIVEFHRRLLGAMKLGQLPIYLNARLHTRMSYFGHTLTQ